MYVLRITRKINKVKSRLFSKTGRSKKQRNVYCSCWYVCRCMYALSAG